MGKCSDLDYSGFILPDQPGSIVQLAGVGFPICPGYARKICFCRIALNGEGEGL